MDCASLSVVVLHSTFSVFSLARGQEEMGKLSHLLQFNFAFSTGRQILSPRDSVPVGGLTGCVNSSNKPQM